MEKPDDELTLIEDFDPWMWAEARGIAVITKPLRGSRFGEWHPSKRTIYLSTGLSAVQEWSTLAHECGHVELGHVGAKDSQEVAANRWAAERLIDSELYEAATVLWGSDLCRIADELGVMMWVVNSWRCARRSRDGVTGSHVDAMAAQRLGGGQAVPHEAPVGKRAPTADRRT